MENIEKVKNFSATVAKIKAEFHKDVVGQEDVLDNVIIAIIAGGHATVGAPQILPRESFAAICSCFARNR